MDLQFSISISSCGIESNLNFYESIDEAFKNKKIKLKEFYEISIFFRGPENFKLFLPELDDFQIPGRQEDIERNKWFIPSSDSINIFSYEQSQTQSIPLVPGFYYFIVKNNFKKYYAVIEIVPKDLSSTEWKLMIDDIENKIVGLSTEFIKRKSSFDSKHEPEHAKANQIQKIEEFIGMIPRARIAIDSLEKESNFAIKKDYSWRKAGSKALIDINSIKMINKHPEYQGMIYSPSRRIEHNISENKWIKYILNYFVKFSNTSIEYLLKIKEAIPSDKYLSSSKYDSSRKYFDEHRHISQIDTINMDIKKLKIFIGYVRGVLNSDLFIDISKERPIFIPKSLVLSAKYNTLYRLYLKMKRTDQPTILASEYKYYWRRTDLLYEIWTYSQIIEILSVKGFFPNSGWIFDIDNNNSVLPFLHDGTKVFMYRGEIKLQVVFNEKIKGKSFYNTLENPIRTYSKRNKPDIRIDIFDSNCYTGSIILDAKYKRFPNIITQNNPGSRKQREQLREYRNAPSSSIIDFYPGALEQFKVVQSVFAVYPRKDDTKPAPQNLGEDKTIIFSELRPGFGFEDFSNNLNKEIENRLSLHDRNKN